MSRLIESIKGSKSAKTVATLAALSIGVVGFSACTADATLRPDTTPHLLQPGETVDELAFVTCKKTAHDTVVNFIIDQSHLKENELGSLQPGTRIVLPDPASC